MKPSTVNYILLALLGFFAVFCIAYSLLAQPAATTDWGLGDLSRDTRQILGQAQELLDRSSGGDTQAMIELSRLFNESWALRGAWLQQGAIRGDEKAILGLISQSLDSYEPTYYTAFAWITAAHKLGVLKSPKVGRHGDLWCDEKWFAERMEPLRLWQAAAFGDRLHKRVLKNTEGGGQP